MHDILIDLNVPEQVQVANSTRNNQVPSNSHKSLKTNHTDCDAQHQTENLLYDKQDVSHFLLRKVRFCC